MKLLVVGGGAHLTQNFVNRVMEMEYLQNPFTKIYVGSMFLCSRAVENWAVNQVRLGREIIIQPVHTPDRYGIQSYTDPTDWLQAHRAHMLKKFRPNRIILFPNESHHTKVACNWIKEHCEYKGYTPKIISYYAPMSCSEETGRIVH